MEKIYASVLTIGDTFKFGIFYYIAIENIEEEEPSNDDDIFAIKLDGPNSGSTKRMSYETEVTPIKFKLVEIQQ